MISSEIYLRPVEAAQKLGFSVNYLAKRRIYGGGPEFVRCGSRIRYSTAALDAFMRANSHSSTSAYPAAA